MKSCSKIRLLYLTPEGWPTHRVDIVTLFGKWLPQWGIESALLTHQGSDYPNHSWLGGPDMTFKVPQKKSLFYLFKSAALVSKILRIKTKDFDAIQVRDMPVIAFFVLLIAKIKCIPFYYWMSYPQSEGQVFRAQARGPSAGMRYWFPLIQGTIGKWLLYKFVLHRADHIFVQSDQMSKDLTAIGISTDKMTPVPMGVDIEAIETLGTTQCEDPRLKGRRVLAYLGTLDRARRIETLFEMLSKVLEQYPDAILLLVGDTEDREHRLWLEQQSKLHQVAASVVWTGWLPTDKAWSYIRGAEIGLSTFPRSYLLDSASPTKVVEYMAIGLPVIGNDNPDQQRVLLDSGGGLCVTLDAMEFSRAVTQLLASEDLRKTMSVNGRNYILHKRGYHKLAEELAAVYKRLLHVH